MLGPRALVEERLIGGIGAERHKFGLAGVEQERAAKDIHQHFGDAQKEPHAVFIPALLLEAGKVRDIHGQRAQGAVAVGVHGIRRVHIGLLIGQGVEPVQRRNRFLNAAAAHALAAQVGQKFGQQRRALDGPPRVLNAQKLPRAVEFLHGEDGVLPGNLAARGPFVRRLAHGQHHRRGRVGIARDDGEAADALAGDILLDAVLALFHPLVEHGDGLPLFAEDEYIDAVGAEILAQAREHGVYGGVRTLSAEHDAQAVQRHVLVLLAHQPRGLERLRNEPFRTRAAQFHIVPAIFLFREQHRVGGLALMGGADALGHLPHALKGNPFRGRAGRAGHKAQEFHRLHAAHGNARKGKGALQSALEDGAGAGVGEEGVERIVVPAPEDAVRIEKDVEGGEYILLLAVAVALAEQFADAAHVDHHQRAQRLSAAFQGAARHALGAVGKIGACAQVEFRRGLHLDLPLVLAIARAHIGKETDVARLRIGAEVDAHGDPLDSAFQVHHLAEFVKPAPALGKFLQQAVAVEFSREALAVLRREQAVDALVDDLRKGLKAGQFDAFAPFQQQFFHLVRRDVGLQIAIQMRIEIRGHDAPLHRALLRRHIGKILLDADGLLRPPVFIVEHVVGHGRPAVATRLPVLEDEVAAALGLAGAQFLRKGAEARGAVAMDAAILDQRFREIAIDRLPPVEEVPRIEQAEGARLDVHFPELIVRLSGEKAQPFALFIVLIFQFLKAGDIVGNFQHDRAALRLGDAQQPQAAGDPCGPVAGDAVAALHGAARFRGRGHVALVGVAVGGVDFDLARRGGVARQRQAAVITGADVDDALPRPHLDEAHALVDVAAQHL